MITLSSDFGTPYPAAMKGVLLRRTDARLVDVAHDFPRQDVRATAFWLREVLPYFPAATHLVVVDPGVGTDRAAIVVEAAGHTFVAPDNGVVVPAVREIAGDDFDVYEVAYDDDGTASNTFHGRDVFAPAAADVHDSPTIAGVERFSPTEKFVDLTFPTPTVDEETATGEVLVVDDFGNVVTNLPGRLLDGLDRASVDGEVVPVRRSYAAVDAGDRVVTVGSHGNVELAVNRGRGDDAFGLSVGDRVTVDHA
ncbi:SAM hydrolase/SAM-dependent halogenase family protein [Halogeometricum limi]|uniref:S-adenosyl-l-methionine hydroxide adenosyltransferase n=1 Tax=Halogeometricum limi TaxID=555875 RepID=A0A1I6GIX2_9EURY|nr:SAM-dependent chlorinase/fluorinase [Halogeometricum limi]SFR42089.1 hypothetical protein SAMN04488124_1107 [Halogeometricum limi]